MTLNSYFLVVLNFKTMTSSGLRGTRPRLSCEAGSLEWQLRWGQVRGPDQEHLSPLSPDLRHLLPSRSRLHCTSLKMPLGKQQHPTGDREGSQATQPPRSRHRQFGSLTRQRPGLQSPGVPAHGLLE